MTDLIIGFGRYAGTPLVRLPDDYVRWLADPDRAAPRNLRKYTSLPADIVAWARARVAELDAARDLRVPGERALQGHASDTGETLYVIECEGDCWSKSGGYAIEHRSFGTLDETLAYLASEFPEDPDSAQPGYHDGRFYPDPEDDRIIVWEVLPSGHRKAVWGFFGWHHSPDQYACGQGTLPGDSEPLYVLAARE